MLISGTTTTALVFYLNLHLDKDRFTNAKTRPLHSMQGTILKLQNITLKVFQRGSVKRLPVGSTIRNT